LRENLTAYDALYVALAEALDCPLLTADARLANAPGNNCTVEQI
jgi:predicted nucleic acid-binding protein